MTSTNKVDLHIHTTASSDGQHSPEEIFEMAKAMNLRAITFSDHNSVANVDRGLELSEKHSIEFVPCFELNTHLDDMDIHLLAFYIDHKNEELHRWLEEIKEAKYEQVEKRLSALQSLDFRISNEDLMEAAKGKAPSGATFLKALLSRNKENADPRLQPYIDGKRSYSPALNFYLDYFRKGKPAFAPFEACSTQKGIDKIKEFGGVPIQAHPSDTGDKNIRKMIKMGLMGLEAYSSYHNDDECEHFRKMTEEHNIIYTAGSDFHGKKIKPNVDFGSVNNNSYEIVERLKNARNKG